MRRFAATLLGLLTVTACGGSGEGPDLSSTVTFKIFKGGENVDCSSVAGIRRVTGTVFNANNTMALRADANCDTGTFELTGIAPGSYSIELVAKGDLAGDTDATLFSARSDVDVPGAPEISLRPEVAFLEVAWNFGEDALAPCADLVDYVAVSIGTGNTQTGNFYDEFPCNATPVVIEAPFSLAEHTIRIEAYNPKNFIDYSSEARRVFDRGDNTYTAMLNPIGGSVLLDWTFSAGTEVSQSCDAPFVQVDRIRASVLANDGGMDTSEWLDCGAARPYVYRARRYAQRRDLELVLEGEGADNRFLARLPFSMPAGDFAPSGLVMEAVGTATVSFEVMTSTCTSPDTTGFDVTVFEQDRSGGEDMVFEESLESDATSVALPPLRYGTYRVHIVQQGPQNQICERGDLRWIDARENEWDPFVF